MSKRYIIQCAHLRNEKGNVTSSPRWFDCAEQAHTLWGARVKWWRLVNAPIRTHYLFRIYDLHEGKVVE